MNYLKNPNYFWKHILAIPIVSSLVIPIIIMDIWVELYHRTCFPLYRVPYVKRSAHMQFSRQKLSYLSFWQKLYCLYCDYGRGVICFWREIAAHTEKYWCGVKDRANNEFHEPEHQQFLDFADYGDNEEFKHKYKN